MNDLTGYIIYVAAWFAFSIVLHEMGHYTVARVQGFKPTLRTKRGFAVAVEGVKENSVDDRRILLGGVVGGYIPTALTILFVNAGFGAILFLAWTIGNWRELKLLHDVVKE